MPQDEVYIGVWTNYVQGRVLGATLTTTSQQGNLLIAITGFLIPFVASRFWRIMCLVLHYRYSTSDSRPAIHHQRQVILRNSSSPDSGLAAFIRLLWSWRSSASKQELWFRIAPLSLYAAACLLVFTAAGGLSSQISTSTGSEVLLRGENCNIPSPQSTSDTASISFLSQTLSNTLNYAQQCYGTNSSGNTDLSCDQFVVRNLPTAVYDYEAACPFQEGMCRGNSTAVYFDTGYIESNRHLGLNTPMHESFDYRYVLQCSPIVTEGFYTANTDSTGKTSVRYDYGGLLFEDGKTGNYTYEVPSLDVQYYDVNFTGVVPSHELLISLSSSKIFNGTTITTQSSFVPSPEISRQDGDVTVVFLSGAGVIFETDMDDEWYRATTPTGSPIFLNGDGESVSSYMTSEAASPMACVDQFQWCSYADGRRCGPLAGFYDALYGAAPLFNVTAEELESARPSSPTATGSSFVWPYLILQVNAIGLQNAVVGAKNLQSQNLLLNGIQTPLPLNQWQLDVTNWWNTTLAIIQSSFVNTAIGTTTTNIPPANEHERELCHSQKFISNKHTSFSLFGLLFTYLTGALIVMISFLAEPLWRLVCQRRDYGRYELLEWTVNDALQLHRLAQEEIQMGTWTDGTKRVPITERGEMLASLDITNPKHPVFRSFPSWPTTLKGMTGSETSRCLK